MSTEHKSNKQYHEHGTPIKDLISPEIARKLQAIAKEDDGSSKRKNTQRTS